MITKGLVLYLHWDEQNTATQEATLEIQHLNGDTQMFVIPVIRMTERIKRANPNTNLGGTGTEDCSNPGDRV
jgi:hypothetical protein